jgi:hypothetical protein
MAEQSINKLNPQWVTSIRKAFLEFLHETDFPEPKRNGERGSEFLYPEWLIMLIAILSVKAGAKSYLAIHRLAKQYWPQIIGREKNLKLIAESSLRDRLKKIRHSPGKPAGFIFQIFPPEVFEAAHEKKHRSKRR